MNWTAKNLNSYYSRHREEIREKRYKKKYGLKFEEVQQLINKQNNKCLICERNINIVNSVVDHDHELTGRSSIRGILCYRCNMALGIFKDGKLLKKALKYLNDFAVI